MNNDILVVIDCQNDFINGALKNEDAIKVVPNIVKYIKNFNGGIICTFDTHDENYLNTLEGQKLSVKHCIKGTEGWELNKDIKEAVQLTDIDYCHVLKDTFGSTDNLETALQYKGVNNADTIYICGFDTDICVVSNALITRANFPNKKIVVLKDLCAGTSKEAHEAALTVMKSCQIDIE